METITVQVGSIITGNSGQTNDNRREVQFVGEQRLVALARRAEYLRAAPNHRSRFANGWAV